MAFTISDCERARNLERITNSDSRIGTLQFMGAPASRERDTTLSQYVRWRIEQHVAAYVAEHGHDRGSLLLLAQIGHFKNPSTIAMVKRGTGVGASTAPNFARAFGFASVDALTRAASEWLLGRGVAANTAAEAPATEAMEQGIEAALLLRQGTPEQIRTVMEKYTSPAYREMPADWWRDRLLADLKVEREFLARAVRDESARKEATKGLPKIGAAPTRERKPKKRHASA